MFYRAVNTLDKIVGFKQAKAHCDIPCGIYDPHHALIGALTSIRMIDLMTEMGKEPQKDNLEYHNSMARYVEVKEEHAELTKHEIRVIWGDYIKQDHIDKYPELPSLVHRIMQLGSKTRQTTDRKLAMELLENVNRFAEIFWETKGVKSKRVKAPYAPGEEMVLPDL